MKQPSDIKCRMCYKALHTKYIVMRCTTLAPSEYTNRHSKIVGYIHWTICKHMGLQVTDKYHENILEEAINVNCTTIIQDVGVITDRTILAN